MILWGFMITPPVIRHLEYISRHGIRRVTLAFHPREVIEAFHHRKSRTVYVPMRVITNWSQIRQAPSAVFDIAPRERNHEVCCGAHT